MFDIDSIKAAKESARKNQEKQSDNYNKIFETAVDYFDTFLDNQEVETIKNAVEKFSEAQKLMPSKPEPYFMIAVSFYYIGRNAMALKYLNVLRALEPEYPDLNNFYHLISKEMG